MQTNNKHRFPPTTRISTSVSYPHPCFSKSQRYELHPSLEITHRSLAPKYHNGSLHADMHISKRHANLPWEMPRPASLAHHHPTHHSQRPRDALRTQGLGRLSDQFPCLLLSERHSQKSPPLSTSRPLSSARPLDLILSYPRLGLSHHSTSVSWLGA
jgi:hypothetical protein